MKCLILAAGYATRLYPLTENFPKPLLKVGEKSILDWLVDDLVDTTDIDEFVVISNHKFAQHFENWKNEKVKTRPHEINPYCVFSLAIPKTDAVLLMALKNRKFPLIISERNDPARFPAEKSMKLLRNFVYKRCEGLVCRINLS